MPAFLLFRLYGPMASWGEIAVGEYRPTSDHPTRSAITGLISAAYGIKRDDQKALDAVSKGFKMAFRLDSPGTLISDYHTTQVPASGKGWNKKSFTTRKDELSGPVENISTVLSTREYRCDSITTVCIEATGDTPYSLPDVALKLRSPVFVLYLGRKSCPPSLPLSPIVVAAVDAKAAFSQFDKKTPLFPGMVNDGQFVRVFWEDDMVMGISPRMSTLRRDNPGSRSQWQFRSRTEHSADLSDATGDN
ncbi:MAG: type I-E CRISPR-associated protein Cas5/CasD [Methanoregula sp.]|nr:type I-E CRISPR-associated protein Cas5/CasD [Methanoregula sp.]